MHAFKRLVTIAILTTLTSYSVSPPALARKSSGRPAPWVGVDLQDLPCKGARIPFGPFDYLERDKFSSELFITEEYHLNDEILQFRQATASYAINDIQYTLMAWPNHHVALEAVYRYRLLHPGKFPRGINDPTPGECLLRRATNFSPRDPVPHMLMGMLMHKFERYEEALKSFRKANNLLPNDIITIYNMGLTLVALELYDEANEAARTVYAAGFPLPGLKNKLIEAGHWKSGPGDPPAPGRESRQEEAVSVEVEAEPSLQTDLALPDQSEEAAATQGNEEISISTEEQPPARTAAASGDSVPVGGEGVDAAIVRQ